jgi:hypothetical protein
VTCAFYLGVNILLDATMFGVALWKGGFGFYFSSHTAGIVFFGFIWLLSFALAWQIVLNPAAPQVPEGTLWIIQTSPPPPSAPSLAPNLRTAYNAA